MYHRSLHKQKEKGQGLVEYALILVLVAIVVIAALMILGPIIGNVFSKVNSSLSGVSGGGAAAPAAVSGDCTVKYADGYATALNDPNGKCYSPSKPGYYNP